MQDPERGRPSCRYYKKKVADRERDRERHLLAIIIAAIVPVAFCLGAPLQWFYVACCCAKVSPWDGRCMAAAMQNTGGSVPQHAPKTTPQLKHVAPSLLKAPLKLNVTTITYQAGKVGKERYLLGGLSIIIITIHRTAFSKRQLHTSIHHDTLPLLHIPFAAHRPPLSPGRLFHFFF